MSIPQFSVRNPVLVNLVMGIVLIGGLFAAVGIVREMFPPLTPDKVLVTVVYPGAAPEEVERSIATKIEEKIKNIDDIESIESVVNEGACVVSAEVRTGVNIRKVADEIDREVKKIDTFPPDAEEPDVKEEQYVLPAIMVTLYGDASDPQLREAGDRLERELSQLPGVTDTAVSGVGVEEIRIEVDPEKLVSHGLSFAEVGAAVRRGNLDLPAGRMKADGGDLLLRTRGETLRVEDIKKIPIRADSSGRYLRVGDVAAVIDGFNENRIVGRFNGKRSVSVTLLAKPGHDAVAIADHTKAYVEKHRGLWEKQGLSILIHSDLSRYVRGRLDLLTRNGLLGLVLVLVALAALLDLRVAFWVAIGLPVSFLGTILMMRFFGITLNLVTMFGLIVVLGLIVDDAIIVGENIYYHMKRGLSPAAAAIRGAEEVTWPVIAAVSTSSVAFLPMLFIEGRMGKFLGAMSSVVVIALAASLVEAFLILPSHMADWIKDRRGQDEKPGGGLRGLARAIARWRNDVLDRRIGGLHERFVRFCLRHRYETLGTGIFIFLLAVGLFAGKRVPFEFFHIDDSETLICTIEMPEGTPLEETERAVRQVERFIKELPPSDLHSVSIMVGNTYNFRSGTIQTGNFSHMGQFFIELVPLDEGRTRGSDPILTQLRERSANIPGIKKLRFLAMQGGGGDANFVVELRGEDLDEVREVSRAVRKELAKYPAVHDIEDTDRRGKVEIGLRLKDSAAAQGLTVDEIAGQVRAAYYGLKAQTLQRESRELEVWVRLPLESRRRIQDLDQLRISLPGGQYTTLGQVADLTSKRGFSSIRRVDGMRTITVSASIDMSQGHEGSTTEITTAMTGKLDELMLSHPGVAYRWRGQAEDRMKAMGSLMIGFAFALFVIYAILASILRSYTQPIIIVLVIPFGFTGAIVGHWILGYPMSLLSMIGLLALTGIVVNDSIILVDFINRAVGNGVPLGEAVVQGSRRRLTAILLTSVTTIFALLPMMLEKSLQARFLIPMAVSLSFGLAYATVVTLIFLPCFYMIREDFFTLLRYIWTWRWEVRGTAVESHGVSSELGSSD